MVVGCENGRLCAVQSTEPGTLSTSCCKRLTISGHAGLLCQSQFRPHGLQKIQTDKTGRLGNLDNRFNRDRAKYIRYRMFKAFVHRHGKESSFVPCSLQIIPRACFDRPWSIQHNQTQKPSRCCPSLAGVCDWLATCLLLTQKRQALTGDISVMSTVDEATLSFDYLAHHKGIYQVMRLDNDFRGSESKEK